MSKKRKRPPSIDASIKKEFTTPELGSANEEPSKKPKLQKQDSFKLNDSSPKTSILKPGPITRSQTIRKRLESTSSSSSHEGDYNTYYASGEYKKRYKGKTNDRDPAVLLQAFRRTLLNKINQDPYKNDHNFNISDYACGNGRFFGAVEEIFKEAKEIGKKYQKNITVNYIGSDPTSSAIDEFRGTIGGTLERTSSDGTRIWKNNTPEEPNLTTYLINHKYTSTPEHIQQNILQCSQSDKIDLLMCMYGSLSHIKEPFRGQTLDLFSSILSDDGELVMTLPNKEKRFLEEQKDSKKEGRSTSDIYYGRRKGVNDIYYHLWTEEEIMQELGDRGFNMAGSKIHISHTIPETTLTSDKKLAEEDRMRAIGMLRGDGSIKNMKRGDDKYEYETKEVGELDKLMPEAKDSQYFLVSACKSQYKTHSAKPKTNPRNPDVAPMNINPDSEREIQ